MTANKLRNLLLFGMALPMALAFASVDNGEHDRDKQVAKEKAKAKADMRRAMHEAQRAQRDAQREIESAQEMLERSMRQVRDINVVAIITRMGDCTQRLKVEQKANGCQLSTVLAPLSMQGVTLMNRGSKSFTYWPDQRIMVEADNDGEDADQIAQRAELAAQNYALSVDAVGSQVAGRATVCVTAQPRVPGIPARQFFLDEQTLYPLRTLQQYGNQWRVNMDTVVVNFPKEMPDVELNMPGTPRKVKFDPALPLAQLRHPEITLHFSPMIPKRLPYGFTVQRAELRRNEDGQLVMLWLTDGLATARVYEFRCNQMREGIWSQGSSTVLTEDGVTMMIVSDLQTDVRRKLLAAFAHRTPSEIAPPASGPSVGFTVKPPPVPSEEPDRPKQLLITPEPEPGIATGSSASSSDSDSDSDPDPEIIAIGQAKNVKGE